MSDALAERKARASLGSALIAGAASGALCVSVLLSIAFLVPVQSALSRGGRRAGLLASGASLFTIAAVLGYAGWKAGAFDPLAVLGGLAVPLLFLAALLLLNARFWQGLGATWRLLAVAALCVAVATPGIVYLLSDPGFAAFFEGRIQATIEAFFKQTGGGAENFEASALRAALDAKAIAAEALLVFSSTYGAMILGMLGLNYWLGGLLVPRALAEGEQVGSRQRRFSTYRVPGALLWPFLFSWSAVLAVTVLEAEAPFPAIAWNLALALSLPYAGQGLGIASHFMSRLHMPRSLRVALAALAIIALATPATGLALGALLPILGVTEVWIPYRNVKGVGA